jgi:hypothetical protein
MEKIPGTNPTLLVKRLYVSICQLMEPMNSKTTGPLQSICLPTGLTCVKTPERLVREY